MFFNLLLVFMMGGESFMMRSSKCCHLLSAKLYTSFFIIMRATGYTPEIWKMVETVHIDKENGGETDKTSLRPVRTGQCPV